MRARILAAIALAVLLSPPGLAQAAGAATGGSGTGSGATGSAATGTAMGGAGGSAAGASTAGSLAVQDATGANDSTPLRREPANIATLHGPGGAATTGAATTR